MRRSQKILARKLCSSLSGCPSLTGCSMISRSHSYTALFRCEGFLGSCCQDDIMQDCAAMIAMFVCDFLGRIFSCMLTTASVVDPCPVMLLSFHRGRVMWEPILKYSLSLCPPPLPPLASPPQPTSPPHPPSASAQAELGPLLCRRPDSDDHSCPLCVTHSVTTGGGFLLVAAPLHHDRAGGEAL